MSHSKTKKTDRRKNGARCVAITLDETPIENNGVMRGMRLKHPLEYYLDLDDGSYVSKGARVARANIEDLVLRRMRIDGRRPVVCMSSGTLRSLMSSYEIIERFCTDLTMKICGAEVHESDNFPDGVICIGDCEEGDKHADYIYLSEVWGGSGGYRVDVKPAALHEEMQEHQV